MPGMSDLFQLMADGFSKQLHEERSKTQLTLGKLIDLLESIDQSRMVTGLGPLDSYRGYYSDLAFEPTAEARTVAGLLSECRKAMGEVFVGYKGGEFVMGRNTPLWVSPYGSASGDRLMGLNVDRDPVEPVIEPEPD